MAEHFLPREKRTFEYHASAVMVKLESVYFHLMPGRTRPDFETVLQAIALQRADSDEFSVKNNANEEKADLWHLFFMSCVHLAQADRERREKNQCAIAWTYLLDAQYYAGAALFAKSLESAMPEIGNDAIKTAMNGARSKGGQVTSAPWKSVEAEAVRLVKLYGEQGERWGTERKMAAFIRNELEAYASLIGLKMSESRYLQTISDRLKLRGNDVACYLKSKE